LLSCGSTISKSSSFDSTIQRLDNVFRDEKLVDNKAKTIIENLLKNYEEKKPHDEKVS
jgi:hypothetical protein